MAVVVVGGQPIPKELPGVALHNNNNMYFPLLSQSLAAAILHTTSKDYSTTIIMLKSAMLPIGI